MSRLQDRQRLVLDAIRVSVGDMSEDEYRAFVATGLSAFSKEADRLLLGEAIRAARDRRDDE